MSQVFPNLEKLLPQELQLQHVQWLLNHLHDQLYSEQQLELQAAVMAGAAASTATVQAPSQRRTSKKKQRKGAKHF